MMYFSRNVSLVITCIKLFLLINLVSCAQHYKVDVERIEPSISFIAQGDAQVDIRWWHSFENEGLSSVIKQGLKNNLSLKAKDLRLKSTAIETNIARADLQPTLNLTSNSTYNFYESNTANLAVNSSWELDFWGGIEASINKAEWNHQEQLALYRARANLVAGSIANAWLGLISEQEKQLVLAKQFQRTQDALQVISRRFAMGKSSVTNIWQQQKLLKSIEVLQSQNKTNLFSYQQTLALWLAMPTKALNIPKHQVFPLLPKLPEIGMPAQVLKFRPDIEQAFAKVKVANENLAIAISNQYPRVSLRANYSTSKTSVKDLLDDWSGNLIASLALPLFDSGERKSIVEQRKLLLQALILDYQQVWLEAIAVVNQVLIKENQLVKVSKNLAEQLDLAKRTEKLTTIKYLNGKTNYLNLLKAQESILSLERLQIEAKKNVIMNRVLLYRELSHGDFSLNEQTVIVSNDNKGKQS